MSMPTVYTAKTYNNKTRMEWITREFWSYITNPDKLKGQAYSLKILIIADGKAGKSYANTAIVQALLKDTRREVWVYQAPEFAEALGKYAPWGAKVHYFSDFSADKVPQWSIVIVDEGVRSLNSKNAHSVIARRFEEIMTIISHKKMVLIVNCQGENGVLKGYRGKATFVIFRTQSHLSVQDSEEPYIRNNPALFEKMEPKESRGYMISTANGLKLDGWIKFPPMPWWFEHDEALSQCLAEADYTVEEELYKETDEKTVWLAENFIKLYGTEFVLSPAFRSFAAGWLFDYDRALYRRMEPKMAQLANYTKFRAIKMEMDNEKKKEQEDEDTIASKPDLIIPAGRFLFADYVRENYREKGQLYALAMGLYLGLVKMDKISTELRKVDPNGPCPATVMNWIHDFQEKRQGYVFQNYWAAKYGGKLDGRPGKVDWYDENGNIWTLKCITTYKKRAHTFYQNKDFAPEWIEAREKNIPYFFGFVNPAWHNLEFGFEIDPHGSLDIPCSINHKTNAIEVTGCKPVELKAKVVA